MVYIIDQIEKIQELMDLIYQGRRPPRVHTLICSCGAWADLRIDQAAWTGWRVIPAPCCPGCLAGEPYQGPARERFLELIRTYTSEPAP